MPVLGDAHAVVRDDCIGLGIDGGRIDHRFPFQPGCALQIRPSPFTTKRRELHEPGCVAFDKLNVDDPAKAGVYRRIVLLDHSLADSDDGGGIAAGLHLMILRADARAPCNHLQRILWIGKAFKSAFAKRVEGDNRHAALHCFL
jgi:hypothetical protein